MNIVYSLFKSVQLYNNPAALFIILCESLAQEIPEGFTPI